VSRGTAALALLALLPAGGCASEGVEPPALSLTRWVGVLPCPGGGSGPADLTLHEVIASGEPTMYDLVLACGDTLTPEVLRGAWGRDSVPPVGIRLHREGAAAPLRLVRRGTDSLVALPPIGRADDVTAVLLRVPDRP
jgi:hypothetical protein